MSGIKGAASGASVALGQVKAAVTEANAAMEGAKASAEGVAAADEKVEKSADKAAAAKGRKKKATSEAAAADDGSKASAEGAATADEKAEKSADKAAAAKGRKKKATSEAAAADDGSKKSAEGAAAADEKAEKSADKAAVAKGRKKKATSEAAAADDGSKKSAEGAAAADEKAEKSADKVAVAKGRKKKATDETSAADEKAKKSADGAAAAGDKVKKSSEGAAAGLDKKKKSSESAAGASDKVKKSAEGATTALEGMKNGASKASAALEGMSRVASIAVAALGAAAVAGVAAVGTALVALGIRSIKAGSDVEEMMGKFAVVFGQYAEETAAELDGLADAVGRNQYELRGFAATFQDTFVPLGFTRDAAADLSVQLTQLTVDLGSFNNVAEPLVLQDLQSAIVGNHETMRKYGVIITEATLNQQLLAMGISGGTQAATEQEKVLARLAMITAGTTDAQGDAIRTAGSFANQLRALKASAQESVQAIGLGLLPLAAKFIEAFRAIEPALSRIVAGVFAILRNIIEVGIEFVRSLAQGMGINFDTLAGDAETWGANIVTMLANGMAAAASSVISVLNELGQLITYWLAPGSPPRLLPDLPEWGASAMTQFMSGWASGDFSVFDQIYGTIERTIRDMGANLPQVTIIENILGSREALQQAVDQMRTIGAVTEATMSAIVAGTGQAEGAMRAYIQAMLQMQGATEVLEQAQTDLQAVQDITAENFRTWAENINSRLIPAVEAYRQTLAQVEVAEQGLVQAQNALQAIQDVGVDNWRQFSATLSNNVSPAVRAHLNALRQLEQANLAYEKTQTRVNEITNRYDEILSPLNAQLQALRDQQTESREGEELARLNEDINSGWLEGAELREAIARRDEILLQQRIRNTTRARDAELGAAEDEMDAAEEAQQAAEEQAEATRQAALNAAQAEVEAMEQARDAAIAAADAQREAMIAAAESQVETAQAQVDALEEQIAINEGIIAQMQEKLRLEKELADAMKAEVAGGGAGGVRG
ncbi:MAG: hypothetical protein KA314_05140, partial [Chloroflexi bacterium]|nr:hypothetical protein [Chloroflexota bacterium]